MPHDFIQASDELHTLYGDLLRTRHIAQTLLTCDAEDDGERIRETTLPRGFTVLGVREREHVVGVVYCEQLQAGACGQQMQPLDEDQIVDGETPLLQLLHRLESRHWLFVRSDEEVDRFVSRSDLQRAPVRMLLFGLISLFEWLLLDLVQRHYSENEITEALNAGRLQQAQRLHDQRKLRGEELQLADCLQIADKRDLLLAADGCVQALGFRSNNAASHFFGHVEELRDRLVHANDLVGGSNWPEVLSTTRQLAGFLSRVADSNT